MTETLKTLCQLNAPSGNEKSVRDYIISRIIDKHQYTVDPLGNLIVEKRGKRTPKNKVMIAAHMDEVGFIISYIEESGYLRFHPVGGIDVKVVVGRTVKIGKNGVVGVIGTKPIHMLKADEKDKMPKMDELYIDIGAENAEQAEKVVSLGDYATFSSDFVRFGAGLIKAKAIDDRLGCAVMLDMLDADLEYDCTFAFNVQEEVGCRGAAASCYSVNPDCAIVLEATTAADISGVDKAKEVCNLGAGPAVSFMDRSTVYDTELYRLALETAKEKGIACQSKRMVAGGNEAGVIHKTRGGVRTLAISIPCRYIHSPCCVIDEKDIGETRRLAEAMLNRLAEL